MITNDKLAELEQAMNDDEIAEQVGIAVARVLCLKKYSIQGTIHYQTTHGTKTAKGLARAVCMTIADKLTV